MSDACLICNRAKGSDIGSLIWASGAFVRFFHPRTDHWAEHFSLQGVIIVPRTEIGEVTARILDFNDGDRLVERQALQAISRYPSSAARKRSDGATSSEDDNPAL